VPRTTDRPHFRSSLRRRAVAVLGASLALTGGTLVETASSASGSGGTQARRALGLASGTARVTGSLLQRISACESGGNPRAVSADGRYRGKYQFSRATWRAIGGTGDPAKAPESVQDRMAAKLLAARGTSPWPNCA
jgi:soluble lytic murein transglycosylase-like protein